ncbi:MAG: TRAP transporter substrate-binding protein DctP [Rhizobiaceae bacterium]
MVFASNSYAQCDFGEIPIKLGSFNDADHPAKNAGLKLFRETVNKELQGKACLEVILDEARFKGAVGIVALQNSEVHMLVPRFSTLAKFSPPYQAFDLPFAFRDLASVEKFQILAGVDFISVMAINGLEPLAFWHGYFKQISAKKAIYYPADLAGLKLRSDRSPTFARQVTLLNATSQQVAENDLTIAVQSGKIDGQVTNWERLKADGTAKILMGASETNHGFVGYQLLASKNWWGDLKAPIRKRLLEIISRTTRQVNFQTISRLRNTKQNLIRSGVIIRTLTRKQSSAWKTKFLPIWEEFSAAANMVFLEAVRKANAGL